MAGAVRPSTTFLVASSVVVDGGPAPAMTAVGSVALLPDFTVSGLACKAAFMPPPLPLLSPLPPRIKASGQPHKRYGIKHDRANAAATQAVGGWLIISRGSGGRRGRGDDFRTVPIQQRLERPIQETRPHAWIAPDRCQARLVKSARMGEGRPSISSPTATMKFLEDRARPAMAHESIFPLARIRRGLRQRWRHIRND